MASPVLRDLPVRRAPQERQASRVPLEARVGLDQMAIQVQPDLREIRGPQEFKAIQEFRDQSATRA